MDILVKTSYPKPLQAVYYWEKKKQGQILDLKFHKPEVCEEDQHAKLCQKLWIDQVLQLKQPQSC